MSIALDETLSLRSRGELVCAREQVSVAAALLGHLSKWLVSWCVTLVGCGKHMSNLPTVEPLKADFFRGDTGQSAASWNSHLHHVLFAKRSRFFHRPRILCDTLERLDREFNEVADEICSATSTKPTASWRLLDCRHYDFNTCMREAEGLLKSFLRALPAEQLAAFAVELHARPAERQTQVRQPLSRVPV